ncbi:MAG: Rpn family recombination-promoting nuclease/putative transposase [Holosporaceae bacterium]|nr:Rpn family recombination-promoting nuclease/putative transposase [Holosporaceae bacterium]
MNNSIRAAATGDIMFKIILGDPRHSRLLIHFLNCAIKSESPITSVEIVNSELSPDYVGQKGVRLDITAKTENGELINVEMQREIEHHMAARALFYWSRMFSQQIVKGGQYHQLKRTISIGILDFNLFRDDRCWRKCRIIDSETKEEMTELLEIQFIELNKLHEIDKSSPITFWIEFFKNPYSESVSSLCEFVPEINEAVKIYEKAKTDPKLQALVESREKAMLDYTNDIACAEEKGELKGKRETARAMLADGVPLDTVSTYTGLSIDEIKAIS